eukprot:TRINITY_DN1131_c0_g7_i1.p1 TRINITY_DN1131_c0_g7~~TRINITY_DN1131_c0_g7_i1.p1  ORF type:complete len:625 (+),score=177.17 TRINITY_DN1131_c0_g7_i1:56-1930(+)
MRVARLPSTTSGGSRGTRSQSSDVNQRQGASTAGPRAAWSTASRSTTRRSDTCGSSGRNTARTCVRTRSAPAAPVRRSRSHQNAGRTVTPTGPRRRNAALREIEEKCERLEGRIGEMQVLRAGLDELAREFCAGGCDTDASAADAQASQRVSMLVEYVQKRNAAAAEANSRLRAAASAAAVDETAAEAALARLESATVAFEDDGGATAPYGQDGEEVGQMLKSACGAAACAAGEWKEAEDQRAAAAALHGEAADQDRLRAAFEVAAAQEEAVLGQLAGIAARRRAAEAPAAAVPPNADHLAVLVAEARWGRRRVWTTAAVRYSGVPTADDGCGAVVERLTAAGEVEGCALTRCRWAAASRRRPDVTTTDDALSTAEATASGCARALRHSAILAVRGVAAAVAILNWPRSCAVSAEGDIVRHLASEVFALAAAHPPDWSWRFSLAAAEETEDGSRDLLAECDAPPTQVHLEIPHCRSVRVRDTAECSDFLAAVQTARSGAGDCLFVLTCVGQQSRSLGGSGLAQRREGALVVADAAVASDSSDRRPFEAYLSALSEPDAAGEPCAGVVCSVVDEVVRRGGALSVLAAAAQTQAEWRRSAASLRVCDSLKGVALKTPARRRWMCEG